MPTKTPNPPPSSTSRLRPLLKLSDQLSVALLVMASLAAMLGYWFVQGGHRHELIEIDRADPNVAQFQVDLNQADWPELAQMPGIGEKLAQRIVADRERQGNYLDHNDLKRVHGIGPLTLQRIEPYLLPMPKAENMAER